MTKTNGKTLSAAIPLPETLKINSEEQTIHQPVAQIARERTIEPGPGVVFPRWRTLAAGCYLLNYTPVSPTMAVYDGTLRVESHDSGRAASGDLYRRPVYYARVPREPFPPSSVYIQGDTSALRLSDGSFIPYSPPGPNPANGIPILARSRYRYYLEVTDILEDLITFSNSFTLGFRLCEFDSATHSFPLANRIPYTAEMIWITAPEGYPFPGHYLEGDVKDAGGTIVGRLKMGKVSNFLRKATFEIDRVSASETPLDNGDAETWRTIFSRVGWDVNAFESDTAISEPSGESWSDAELHQCMLDWRDSSNLDKEWRYHLLCVRRLDSTSRGLMYDAYGGDSNNIPREGAAISSHWQFTNDPVDPETASWGLCAGLRFGESPQAYFRTAVHEIGHAIMLFHPSASGNFIMQVTPTIANSGTAENPFPNNILYEFSAADSHRLRHLPDVVIRPGSVMRFGTDVGSYYSTTPLSPLDEMLVIEGLRLEIEPVMETFPLGAPVRIDYQLVNKSLEPVRIPADLSMKTGQVHGKVVDAFGNERPFSTILRYLDIQQLRILEPGASVRHSITLLRGREGPLFPAHGMYRIVVHIEWLEDSYPVRLSGEASVMVMPAIKEKHAAAALRLFNTPDTLLVMTIGGDHLQEGIEAIQKALVAPELAPHYSYIEMKRLLQRSRVRKVDIEAAASLPDENTVMTHAETLNVIRFVQADKTGSPGIRKLVSLLKKKVTRKRFDPDLVALVERL